MSKKDEALKLALAVLKEWRKGFPDDWTDFDTEAVTAIEEALAERSTNRPASRLDAYPKERVAAAKADVLSAVERHRLAEQPAQQQEPVAYASDVEFDDETEIIPAEQKGKLGTAGLRIPLYIDPPASKPWVGLTDAERAEIQYQAHKKGSTPLEFMELHEAKLREKNA